MNGWKSKQDAGQVDGQLREATPEPGQEQAVKKEVSRKKAYPD